MFPQQPIKNFEPLQSMYVPNQKTIRHLSLSCLYMYMYNPGSPAKSCEIAQLVVSTIYYLNDVISEINFLSFLSGSVLNIQNADEISRPTSHQTVEELEEDPRHHSQLGT